jgi:hypothetical protein
MSKYGPEFSPLKSRAIGLTIALGALLLLSQSTAHAGMIVPWANDSDSHRNGSVSGIDGELAGLDAAILDNATTSSSVPAGNPANDPTDCPPAPRPENAILAGLLESSGGASTPETGGAGQTSVAPAALGESAVCESPGHAYRQMRESALCLPQPPCEELMDPPKATA